jgi:hypothetical protein
VHKKHINTYWCLELFRFYIHNCIILDDRIRMFSWVSQGLDCWFFDGFNADYNISREFPGFKLLINSYSDIIDNKYPYKSTLCKTKQVGKT